MPSRRTRLPAVLFILFILVLVYITTAKRATYSSPFYTRTVEAISARQGAAAARADLMAGEKARHDRVERLKDEHEIAMSKAKPADAPTNTLAAGITSPEDGRGPVSGRKTTDGKVVVDETGNAPDGVAKVGNVQAKAPAEGAVKKDTEDDRRAEAEINTILKKGPIIIFSKSHCPFSKKAKNILQNLYTIVPPPYVVELDLHDMGPLLQSALSKSTGRRTVPNVLVSGKSIGGGDDIEQLHLDNKLIDTVKSLGGKRIVEIKAAGAEPAPKKPRRLRA